MKNLHDVWSKRLGSYTVEVQNYFKYIFTGHIAVVLLFAIGAAGYAYSDWVQNVPENFPGALLLAVIFGVLLAYSPPSTLLKEADMVYFLPLESKLDEFLKPAIKWSFLSQLYLPVIAFIVSLPMVNALYGLETSYLIGFPILLLIIKWWNVQTEFSFRKAFAGQKSWLDRLCRFVLAFAFTYFYVDNLVLVAALLLFAMILYGKWVQNRAAGLPFPYEHFVRLEENRMLRFYQFANYFTDVPQIKGKIKQRSWLNWIYRFIGKNPEDAHYYLVWRTFIRSDELFYLWVRLTLLTIAGVLLIPFTIAMAIFAGALAFATTIQLWQGLNHTQHFRMDNLFPLSRFTRERAVRKLVVILQLLQALLAALALIIAGQFVTAGIVFLVVIAISLITLTFASNKKKA
ncbi:ABC transporter permease [Planomicrobium sp. MB-3u-38]|uniref:ABC transporter permease n=1 Tax=Planomicrobium sp. MB-3u-38 TaxID=2058318 RepID=UPI000C7B8C11|nr:ABC transporter permease [Planomicrobium sp. MB-3u-38]PKH08882.1 protein EcsB [Planomicrobium sp. MB-3u-38]